MIRMALQMAQVVKNLIVCILNNVSKTCFYEVLKLMKTLSSPLTGNLMVLASSTKVTLAIDYTLAFAWEGKRALEESGSRLFRLVCFDHRVLQSRLDCTWQSGSAALKRALGRTFILHPPSFGQISQIGSAQNARHLGETSSVAC